jgi:hypothetical protein
MLKDATLVVTKEQVTADLQGEAVILHLESGMYYGLDPVGVRVWELLQTPRPFSELKSTLLEEFDVEPETCETHVLALLQQLIDVKLIEVVNA